MIEYIRGELITKLPTYIMIDVNGVGYGLHIPLSTYTQIGELQSTQEIYAYLYVRDDALRLYGFGTREEKALFELLLSVTGVGPRMALGILSALSVDEFREAVNNEDVSVLVTVPGVGQKTGERLLLELRDKISVGITEPVVGETAKGVTESTRDAMSALMSLGCKPREAGRAIREAKGNLPEGCSLEGLIREALKHL